MSAHNFSRLSISTDTADALQQHAVNITSLLHAISAVCEGVPELCENTPAVNSLYVLHGFIEAEAKRIDSKMSDIFDSHKGGVI